MSKKAFPDKDKKALLMTLLKVLGGRKVEITFDGSGDSGSIDYVSLLDHDGKEINLVGAVFDWHEYVSEFNHDQNQWTTVLKPVPNVPVAEILKTVCEDALEESGYDWYNNEGGYGQLTIDLTTTPPQITLDVHIRVMDTDDYEIDLTHDEEEESEIDPEAVPLPTHEEEEEKEGDKNAPISS